MKNKFVIKENSNFKLLRSKHYNYNFDKNTGYFERWGKTRSTKDDPQVGLPEIADIEICSGGCSGNCRWCYKSNSITKKIKYMSLEAFMEIFHKLPRSLTQIALGITDISANPNLKEIIKYCRNNDYQSIVPNITINGNHMTGDWYDFLAEYCGAVAVSHYSDDICFDAVKNLTDRGLKQVNIHKLLSEDTYNDCFQLLHKRSEDERLKNMNAIVFLSLKEKGDRNNLKRLIDQDKYDKLIKFALDNKISIGFDSCGCQKFIDFANRNSFEEHIQMSDPCESACYSIYCNVDGEFYPCSFMEGVKGWEEGISIKYSDNFIRDVWFSEKTDEFRRELLNNNRNCPQFEI